MGCCKLVGEKKTNKIYGQGNLSAGDGDGTKRGSGLSSHHETLGNIQDPSFKSNMTPNSKNKKQVAIGVTKGN